MSRKKSTKKTKGKRQSKAKKKSNSSKGQTKEELSIGAGEYAKIINSPAINTCYKPDCPRHLLVIVDGHWQKDFQVAHIQDHKEPTPGQLKKGIGHRYYPAPANEKELRKREQYGNLILLCKPCHTTIDKTAPKDYSVELLHEWKSKAETDELRTRFKTAFGDKALTEQDWTDALLDGSAITSVHMVSEQALEALDPRISVTSQYSDGRTAFRLDAKEPVQTDWIMGGDTAYYADKLEGMIKRAQPFSIKSEDLTIKGSDLLAKITEGNDGVMVLSPTGIPATVKLSLSQTGTDSEFRFDDILGNIMIGTEVMVFDGTCFDGLFKLHIEAPTASDNATFNIDFELSKWKDQDIRDLPYFQKIHEVLYLLGEGESLSGAMEFKGTELFKFSNPTDRYDAISRCDYQCVVYTEACRKITKHFDQSIKFDDEIEFTKEEHVAVRQISDFVEMVSSKKQNEKYSMSTSHVATEEIFTKDSYQNHILNGNSLTVFVGTPALNLKLFHQHLDIPRRANFLNAMVPKIQGEPKPEIGETYDVKWISSDETCPCFYFEDEEHPIPDHISE